MALHTTLHTILYTNLYITLYTIRYSRLAVLPCRAASESRRAVLHPSLPNKAT